MNDTMKYLSRISTDVGKCDVKARILFVLLELKVNPDSDGFYYLRECILCKYKNMGCSLGEIYQQVMDKTDRYSSYSQIDQAIRHTIKAAWFNHNLEVWKVLFPVEVSSGKTRPSNGYFISYVACLLELLDSCIGMEESSADF